MTVYRLGVVTRLPRRGQHSKTFARSFADALDGAKATVPNARWRKVICDSLMEIESPETKQPA